MFFGPAHKNLPQKSAKGSKETAAFFVLIILCIFATIIFSSKSLGLPPHPLP
jgi:hypothetical protein